MCIENLCANPRWTVVRRGEHIAISSYCLAHATLAMFGYLEDEDESETPERNDCVDPDAAFRAEVWRQRLERESRS